MTLLNQLQKWPSRVVLIKRCSKNMPQVHRRICSKFTREHPCRNVISINLQSNFIKITLRHGCSPVNLQHIFRTPFPKSTSEWLLLIKYFSIKWCHTCIYLTYRMKNFLLNTYYTLIRGKITVFGCIFDKFMILLLFSCMKFLLKLSLRNPMKLLMESKRLAACFIFSNIVTDSKQFP